MVAGLVCGATRVCPILSDGTLVDPVQELADPLVLQLLDRGAASPLLPLAERGKILVPGAACHSLRMEVTLHCGLEGGCHVGGSYTAGSGFDAGFSQPAALLCVMLPLPSAEVVPDRPWGWFAGFLRKPTLQGG